MTSTILIVAILVMTQLSAALDIFQIPFTTDFIDAFGTGLYGPDGPWHAAVVMLGTHQRDNLTAIFDKGPRVPVWPTGSTIVQLLTTEGGGAYEPSANATEPFEEFGNGGDNFMRLADFYANQRSEGAAFTDGLTISNMRFEGQGYANVNATIYAMNTSRVELRDGRSYAPPVHVGNLGLGRPKDTDFVGESMLGQMKSQGLLKSNSFGLHLGSAQFGQKGSLILGGYEENRVLGTVGVFEMQLGTPVIWLVDVQIGVETGRWPFASPPNQIGIRENNNGSIWEGKTNDPDADFVIKYLGGKEGSIALTPNPAVPGIYLPAPTCANAAKHLPVIFDDKTGYYFWDTTSQDYHYILNSAAFLSFILADTSVTNVTIKVPFKALNLTLESPIVDAPRQYFPCFDTSTQGSGYWELGRAFLQSAFFGINFDQNVTFLAQAPGPRNEQSVVRELLPGEKTVVARPAESWADTWRGLWLALEEGPSDAANSGQNDGKLGTAAIAGIAVGGVVGVALLGAAMWWVLRRQRIKRRERGAVPASKSVELNTGGKNRWKRRMASVMGGKHKEDGEGDHGEKKVVEADGDRNDVHEVGDTTVKELASPANMSELSGAGVPSTALSEAPTSPMIFEMPVETFDFGFAKREEGR
jgi:hypothetical protein